MKTKLFQADFLLLITAFIWGGSFVIVKGALEVISPLQVIAYRFTLAFIFLSLFYAKTAFGRWRKYLFPGIYLGLLLGIAFTAQTYGLRYSTPSTSAFITGLNVVMVAVCEALFFRKKLPFFSGLGVLIATVGLSVLTWKGCPQFQIGDFLTLICALFFALHIVATGRLVTTRQAGPLTVYQFGTVSILAWILSSPHLEQAVVPAMAWPSLVYLGILSTALAFLFQTTAQRRTTPVRTAIILSTEPAFAALIAVVLGYEKISIKLTIGGLLILIGMILTSLEEPPRKKEDK